MPSELAGVIRLQWVRYGRIAIAALKMGNRSNLSSSMDHVKLAGRWQTRRELLAIGIGTVIVLWYVIFHTKALSPSITVSWSFDYGPDPACSAARTDNCIDHFEIEDITNQSKMVTIRSVGNPGQSTGKVTDISTTFRYGPPFGRRTISVIAVGRDPKGNRVTSNPFAARVTESIWPSAKISLNSHRGNQ
jgi:hypothetical protein